MTSLLFLSTRDGELRETYNTFWSINLPRLNTLQGFEIALQNIEFPNLVYPINAYNNKLYISEDGGGTLTATLTPNAYTGDQMAAELKTQLEAAGAGTYTVTYDKQSKKFTIAVSGAKAAFAFVDGATNAYEAIGFDSVSLPTSAASLTSSYPVNLSGSQYVDVVTNFSSHNYSVSTTAHVLVRVPLNENFGSIIFYEPSSDDSLFVTTNQLDEIYMQLRDDKGNYWELPYTSHVSMTLKITPKFESKQ